MSRCQHDVVPGRKEGTLRCKRCSWRWPCREDNCGHLDCIEFKHQMPKCYYCGERVQGAPGGVCMPDSLFDPVRFDNGDNASWTPWSVHGHTRAVHYCCRDAQASTEELVRWYGTPNGGALAEFEPCLHTRLTDNTETGTTT